MRRRPAMAGLLLLLAPACSPVRGLEAAALLADIARPAAPEAGARQEIAYDGADGPRRGLIFRPGGPSRGALVMAPGAAERALEDPRLIGFADAFRNAGFTVPVPEPPDGDALRVSAEDAGAVADAARRLLAEGAPAVGYAALSYAAGPVVLAALSDDLRDRTAFLLAIGGYRDVTAGIAYLTTGAYRDAPGAPWRRAEIDARAKWVFLGANLHWLDDPKDSRVLAELARLRRRDPGAAAPAARLGPQGRAVLALMENDDPDRVPSLIAALPARMRAEIAALDLSARDLSGLSGALILVHGRRDPLSPWTESLALAPAAGRGPEAVHLLDGLDHVDLGGLGPADFAELLRAALRLLAARDAAAAG